MILLGIISTLAILTGSTISSSIKCPDFYAGLTEEQAILQKFDSAIKSSEYSTIEISCPEGLMRAGYYDVVELLVRDWYIPRKLDVVDNLRATANYLKREMDKKVRISNNFNHKQTIYPVLKWGQNYTHTLIYVKFAHRFDSPGCLDVWGKDLNFTSTGLSFKALGIQTDLPLEFRLAFRLFREIVPEESSFKSESVGTMVVHLKKKEEVIWRHLLEEGFEKGPMRIKVWWELADIYKKAMRRYNKLIDEEEERNDGVRWSKEDTKRHEKKKIKAEQEEKWIEWLSGFQ